MGFHITCPPLSLQVRLVQPWEALNPLALKAAARGSHGARKHLLLASIEQPEAGGSNGQAVPMYISFAPESGFGRATQAVGM